MSHRTLAVLTLLAACLLAGSPVLAQDKAPTPQTATPPAQPAGKPQENPAKPTPVVIEHDDADPVGARLAYHIKELLGRSSLMRLTNKDEKKLVLVLKTKEEFPGRPNLCSIYSASWLFSSREGALKYFLTAEAGIVDASGIDQTAETLLAQTDKLATTYGYLFQGK